jgi:hypothetical protein
MTMLCGNANHRLPNAGDTLTPVASGIIWYELARSAN